MHKIKHLQNLGLVRQKYKQNIDTNQEYKYGFTTDIENIRAPKGLSEESVKFISNI